MALLLAVSPLTAEAAASFKPNASMLVNVWTNSNDKGFRYPELSTTSNYFVPSLNAKPNFGIAVVRVAGWLMHWQLQHSASLCSAALTLLLPRLPLHRIAAERRWLPCRCALTPDACIGVDSTDARTSSRHHWHAHHTTPVNRHACRVTNASPAAPPVVAVLLPPPCRCPHRHTNTQLRLRSATCAPCT